MRENGQPVERHLLILHFSESKYPFLLDITSLLYDLELAYDFGVLLTEKDYLEFEFSRYFWYRAGRPLRANHRIRAATITKTSPLTIELIPGSIVGLWALVQIIQTVYNWPLNREKSKLEAEKLRLEVDKLRGERAIKELPSGAEGEELEALAEERRAANELRVLRERLNKSHLSLEQLEVRRIQIEDPDEDAD